MRSKTGSVAWLTILLLLVSGSLAIIEKSTIFVPGYKTRCFGQIFGDQASYKFKYTTLDEVEDADLTEKEKQKLKHTIEVTIRNPISNLNVFHSKAFHNSTSLYLKDGAILYEVCIANNLEPNRRVRVEISSGLDINDFANLPLQVRASYQNETESLNRSLLILENLVKDISPLTKFTEIELHMVDHSSRLVNVVLSYAGVGIGFMVLAGCGQAFLLQKRLLDRKLA